MVHALLHLLVPGVVALLLDLDHVLATPMFDPNRCSINFHPLHTYWAMGGYVVTLFPRVTRVWAVGFLLHMALDYTECWQLGIIWPK